MWCRCGGRNGQYFNGFVIGSKIITIGSADPDKAFIFTIGGFEPGINVDGMGIAWVTGGEAE